MSSPAPNTALPRADIQATLEAFDLAASRQGFVGLDIAPPYPAPRPQGDYKVLAIEELLQDHPTERNIDGTYRRGVYSPGEKTYSCRERGFEIPVDDQLAAQYRDYFDAEAVAAEIARDVVLRQMEAKIVNAALTAGNVGGTTSIGTNWDQSAATPIADTLAGKLQIRSKCGFMPNTMVMDIELFEKLLEQDEIVEKIASSGSGDTKVVTRQTLQQILKIERIVVADAQKNTVIPHQHASNAKVSLASLWDKTKVFLAYIDRRRNLQFPTWARTFHWDKDGGDLMGTIETYRDERVRGDVVRCRTHQDANVVVKECAWLLTDVL